MAGSSTWNKERSSSSFVLVVDSEPENLIFTSMIIQRLEYHACSALGVGNALEIAVSAPPLLVVTDLHLKGLSGLDLLERLKQKPSTSTVPVVIMVRELTPEVAGQCSKAGATAVLQKPLQANELYQAIHPILEPGTRRRHIRIKTRLSVMVDGRPLDCVDGECATNLSVGGLHLLTHRSYREGSEVTVGLKINEQEIEAEAMVAYCQPPRDCTGLWDVGLQFVRTSPGAGEIVRKFIHDEVTHGMDTLL